MSEWQPIETAPKKDGQQVLLGRAGWGAILAEWNGSSWSEQLGGEFYGTRVPYQPTHWKIVGEPPKYGGRPVVNALEVDAAIEAYLRVWDSSYDVDALGDVGVAAVAHAAARVRREAMTAALTAAAEVRNRQAVDSLLKPED